MKKMFRKMSQLTEEITNKSKEAPHVSLKQVTEIQYKALQNKIDKIKEACARLKNDGSISKTAALKEIKNICNSKEEMDKEWQTLLSKGVE